MQPFLERSLDDYVRCALWSSTDNDDEPLDRNYTSDDIVPESLAKMRADVEKFIKENEADIDGNYTQAAHDFWLTRNGHGAGFWDGDWPKKARKRLTDAAHACGECDLYLGDDGLLHLYP